MDTPKARIAEIARQISAIRLALPHDLKRYADKSYLTSEELEFKLRANLSPSPPWASVGRRAQLTLTQEQALSELKRLRKEERVRKQELEEKRILLALCPSPSEGLANIHPPGTEPSVIVEDSNAALEAGNRKSAAQQQRSLGKEATKTALSKEQPKGKFNPDDYGGKELCIIVSYAKAGGRNLKPLASVLSNRADVGYLRPRYKDPLQWYLSDRDGFKNHVYRLRKKAKDKGWWDEIPSGYCKKSYKLNPKVPHKVPRLRHKGLS